MGSADVGDEHGITGAQVPNGATRTGGKADRYTSDMAPTHRCLTGYRGAKLGGSHNVAKAPSS